MNFYSWPSSTPVKVEHDWFYVLWVEYDGTSIMIERGKAVTWDYVLAYVNTLLAREPLDEKELREWVDHIRSRGNPTPTK